MPSPPVTPTRVVLIGAGKVGTAVAALLQKAGSEIVGVASRTAASASTAAERLGAPEFSGAASDPLPEADTYLIGVPDAAISEVASSLRNRLPGGATLVHFSGSLGLGALRDGLSEDTFGAALHPVQSCPDVDTALARLPGSAWGVTCEGDRLEWCFGFVRSVDGVPVEVAEGKRALWHAASVTTSNGLSALLSTGEAFLASASDADPATVLGPLAAGSLANALEDGGGATLTGPIVRGELDTIRRHLDAIDAGAPELLALYLSVARTILEAARRAGRLDAATVKAIEDVLGR